LQKITEGVYEVQMPGPSTLNLYHDDLDDDLLFRMIVALDELRTRVGIDDAVCVVQLPFWASLALGARTRWGWQTVYDCMDEHSGFLNNTSSMLRHEEELMKSSDLVVATSRSLLEKSSSLAKQTALIPNACDFDHFNMRAKTNPLSHLGNPIVGYYGAIADWFDVGMISEAAAARPDWQFVLIGHTFGADISPLEGFRTSICWEAAIRGAASIFAGIRRRLHTVPYQSPDDGYEPGEVLRIPERGQAHRRG
jgi:hypothetical protein